MIKNLIRPCLILSVLLALFLTCTDNSVNNKTQTTTGNTANGYFSILYPEYGEQDTTGYTSGILWTSSGTISSTSYVALALYNDTQRVATISTSTLNDGYFSATIPNVTTGTKYRIKINVYGDTAQYDFSSYFSITSQYSGSFTISNPVDSSVWNAGSSYTIKWSSTGNPGTSCKIQLYKASSLINAISSNTTTSLGAYSWSIPSNSASGTNYRIRISSYYNDSIYEFSDFFTITGVAQDAFEYDGSYDSASPVSLDVIQKHNITNNDTDWISFNADSQITYVAQYMGDSSFRTYISIYNGTTYLSRYYANTYGTYQYVWTPAKKGTYYFAVSSYTSGNTGKYSFRISKLDTVSQAIFTNPTSASTFNAGSTYTVTWIPDTLLFGSYVYLYFYKANTLVTSYSSVSNTGSYSWLVPAATLSGSDYRIKMINSSQSSIYTYSNTFSISGMTSDSYEYDNIRDSAKSLTMNVEQNRNLTSKDTDWVKISADSGKSYVMQSTGTLIYAYLFYGSQTTNTAYFYSTSSSGSMKPITSNPWLCTQTGIYYFRITAYTTGTYGTYTFKVNEFDSTSEITFTNPTDTSTWATGKTCSISYNADTNLFTNTINIYLCIGNTSLQTIASGTTNSGTYNFTLAAGLPTRSDYRIKITNYSNSSIYGYSKLFTINGIASDIYESDDSVNRAKSISTDGIFQDRTIPKNDIDWLVFTAQKDSAYVIRINGDSLANTYLYLYSAAEAALTYSSGYSSKLVWTCPATGSYYLKVIPYSTSYYGSYKISVMQYSQQSIATFTNPVSTTTWNAGSSYSIQWQADTALFGSYVKMALVLDTTTLSSIAASTSNKVNGGTYSWTIPSDKFSSGTNYRIRISSTTYTTIMAYSPAFTISGIVPDAFEPDDSAASAHTIVADTVPENHTMPYLDKDWYSFSAKADRLYNIKTNGSIHTGIQLYSSDKQTLLTTANSSYTDTNATLLWICPNAGTYYFLISNGAYYGSYQTTLLEYDTSAYRYVITAPLATDTITTGDIKIIQWTAATTFTGNVDIFLYNSSGIPTTLISNTANTGTFSWTVSSSLSAGTYYIKVSNVVNSKIFGNSETFTIKAP